MTFEEALVLLMGTNADLKKLIGSRIYPGGVAPEGTKSPYVAFYRIHSGRQHGLPYATPRYQFSVFATTYDAARTVAALLVEILDSYKGLLAEHPVEGSQVINDPDFYEPDTGFYHIPVDIKFSLQTHLVVDGVWQKNE